MPGRGGGGVSLLSRPLSGQAHPSTRPPPRPPLPSPPSTTCATLRPQLTPSRQSPAHTPLYPSFPSTASPLLHRPRHHGALRHWWLGGPCRPRRRRRPPDCGALPPASCGVATRGWHALSTFSPPPVVPHGGDAPCPAPRVRALCDRGGFAHVPLVADAPACISRPTPCSRRLLGCPPPLPPWPCPGCCYPRLPPPPPPPSRRPRGICRRAFGAGPRRVAPVRRRAAAPRRAARAAAAAPRRRPTGGARRGGCPCGSTRTMRPG